MNCPKCGVLVAEGIVRVTDSRPVGGVNQIRRRRACGKCGERFTTYERIGDWTPSGLGIGNGGNVLLNRGDAVAHLGSRLATGNN